MNEIETVPASHEVKIIDRREIYLTGVKKIESFDHEEFLLLTTMGMLHLIGNDLEMIRLDTHDGNLRIKGKINGYNYIEKNTTKIKKESFMEKLFK
jgi:sporulation protein YabP